MNISVMFDLESPSEVGNQDKIKVETLIIKYYFIEGK